VPLSGTPLAVSQCFPLLPLSEQTSDAIPLSAEDRAILALEGPTVGGHTCKTIVLGSPAPTVEQLRELSARVGSVPVLERVLRAEGERLFWEIPSTWRSSSECWRAHPHVSGALRRGSRPAPAASR
jgi:hypothetical protein